MSAPSVTRARGGGSELGYAEITADVTSTVVNTYEDVSGLSVAVTVGARPVIIEFGVSYVTHTGAPWNVLAQVLEGATQIGASQVNLSANSSQAPLYLRRRIAPSAGSHTYKVQWGSNVAGTHTLKAAATYPAFLQVTEV